MSTACPQRLHDFLHHRSVLLLALIAVAVAVHANSLANGFAFDDVPIIAGNPRVHDLTDLRRIWLTPYWPYFGVELGLWRPLAIFAYAVQWALGDGAAWVFHAGNIVMHTGVTILVFLLLERLTARGAAFAGALVFAVHPVHTEAVANVVGQAELIAAGALVAACVVHARRPPGMGVSWARRVALMALFAAAVLTKEHAVVLPGLLLAVDCAQRRIPLTIRGAARYADALLMPLLLLGAVLAAYLIVRFGVLEGSLLGIEAGPQYHFLREEHRVLNALRAFPEFLRLMVFPYSLAADYSPALILPVESVTAMVALGALLLVALVLLSLATPWLPAVGFPAAWFLVSIITVSNLFFPIGVLIAERTLYLASVAVSAGVAFAWAAAAPRLGDRARRLAPLLLAAVVLAGGIRTWVRNPDWASTQTVLNSLVRDHPDSYKAQWTHASWQWQLGNVDAARLHFEYAVMLYPRDSQLLTEFGSFLMAQHEVPRAVALFEEAYRMHAYVPRTLQLLGTAYVAAERFRDALRIADEADRRTSSFDISMPIRAAAWDGLGESDRALATWRFVIRFNSLPAPVHWAFLARSLARRGFDAEAAVAIDRGRAAAATDTAAARIIADVGRAIDAGCFAAPRAQQPLPSNCDPLDADGPDEGRQNAIRLHFARSPPYLVDR